MALLMDPSGISSAVEGGLGLVSGMVDSIMNYNQNKEARQAQIDATRQNMQLQREQFDYAKKLQDTMFYREDNAVQRRSADLQAAGLSKTLAAGSSAMAGPVVSTSAPQQDISAYGNAPQLHNQAMLAGALEQASSAMSVIKQHQDIQSAKLQNAALAHNIRVAKEIGQPVGTASTAGSIGGTLLGGGLNKLIQGAVHPNGGNEVSSSIDNWIQRKIVDPVKGFIKKH